MKRLSWKYIAGLIDGEGCLDFQYICHQDYKHLAPRLRIQLTEPSKFVLENLQTNFGGNLHARIMNNPNWQNSITWQIQGRRVRPILQNIVNHLLIKKEQARFLIWYIDNMMVGKRQDTSPFMDECRQIAIDELKAMKRDPQRLTERAAQRITALM
jgi:hypothetical protein